MTGYDFTIVPGPAAPAFGADAAPQGTTAAIPPGQDFSTVLGRALSSAVAAGTAADQQATAALNGTGDVTALVTSVSKAELMLQTVTTLRDRMVQAVQDIMKMPI